MTDLQPRLAAALAGRYTIERQLGEGGMAVVFLAHDLRHARQVAVKVLRPEIASEIGGDRFEREIRMAAGLTHPHILPVFDSGEAGGLYFYVMPMMAGKALRDRMTGGAMLPLDEALRITRQVASALDYAHRQGIIHRDIKPENILMHEGAALVADFGIGKALSGDNGTITQTGLAVGTPAYMSPEQASADASVDGRSDLYSLGCVLYEMLTGEQPYTGPNAQAIISKRFLAPIPHARAMRDVPELVDQAIVRALARTPVDRFPTAADFAEALLVAEQVERTPSGTTPVGLVAAEKSIVVLPLANMSADPENEYFSDGMTEEIIAKLSPLSGLVVTGRGSVARYKGASRDAREVGKALGVAYVLDGSVRRAGDRIRVSATLVKTADAFQVWSETIDAKLDDIFDVQERVATRIVEGLHVRLTPDEAGSLRRWGTRNAAAYDEFLQGQVLVEHFHLVDKLRAAREHFERALEIDPAFAPAMAGLASAEAQVYRNVDSSPAHLERARSLLRSALAIDPTLTRARFTSGEIKGVSYDYRGAAEEFRRVLEAEPRNYQSWDYLCWALGYMTPPDATEAERACRRAIEINPGYAESYYHLSRALVAQRRFAEANEALDHLADHFPGSYLLSSGRFWARLGEGRPREALADLLRDADVRSTAVGLAWQAAALGQAGDVDAAFAALDRALAQGYRDVASLRAAPHLDPLRRDPRFEPLLARHGIPPQP